ncbi:MAG: hypothetical protein ACI9XC_002499 [Gammaproteobacteria bacterium]
MKLEVNTMKGSCVCKNIEIEWLASDFSHIPRVCQCDYCRLINASYVSQSGTEIHVTIHDEDKHKVVMHGTNTAAFHVCTNCDSLTIATSLIDGTIYGVINSKCLENQDRFKEPQTFSYEGETLEQRLNRRKKNWCSPVLFRHN